MALSKITNGGIGTVDDITLSGGVYLGGTGSDNYLQDYETGTFTPSMGSGSGSITTQSATGVYVKIGTLCHVYMTFTTTNKGTASGTITFSGLPFTSAESTRVSLHSRENAQTGVYEQAVIDNSATTGFFKGTGGGNITLQTGNVRFVTGTYRTT